MLETKAPKYVKSFVVSAYNGLVSTELNDYVSVEEPLEIRVVLYNEIEAKQIAVTMRTPEFDRELAAGFLFTEGLLDSATQIERIDVEHFSNQVSVLLKDGVEIDAEQLSRHSFVASSCGVCGKKTIDAVRVKRKFVCSKDSPVIHASLIHSLPAKLKAQQSGFQKTGGLHASILFDLNGRVLSCKEDVGRHNALDKLIGEQFLLEQLPLTDTVLLLSGRASFELVQKAAHAGIPIIAAVGAPSSLAVELAEESKMTLLGFVRDDRFNVYSCAHRIQH